MTTENTAPDKPHWSLALFAAVLSGGLYFAATGLHPFWPLVWIAPLPVLYIAYRCGWIVSALCAFAAFAIGKANLFEYFAAIVGNARSAVIPTIAFAAFSALIATLIVLASRLVVRRLPPPLAVFAFPSAWAAYEFGVAGNNLTGSLFSIAYSQTEVLPLIQTASVTGIFGVAFLLSLVPSALSTPWRGRPATVLAPAGGLILAALAFGALRLASPQASQEISIAAISDDRVTHTGVQAVALAGAGAYGEHIDMAAGQGAALVLLPEKIAAAAPADLPAIEAVFSEAAARNGVTVIAGLQQNSEPKRNVAIAFGPGGELARYAKRHMAPGENNYALGTGAVFTDIGGVRYGLAICKDMDFPTTIRGYGQGGARIMVVPAWDFTVDGDLHARVAIMRGVENGFALVRSARDGLATVSDSRGRVLARASSASPSGGVALTKVRPGDGPTPYARFGDWFAWTCVAAILALLTATFVPKRRLAIAAN